MKLVRKEASCMERLRSLCWRFNIADLHAVIRPSPTESTETQMEKTSLMN